MIDPLIEELVLPREATRYFPRGPTGKPIHVAGIYRYMSVGVRGVILESLDTPRRCTSVQAITRFIARLNGTRTGPSTPASPRSHTARERAHHEVEQELDQLGI
jgi:hypothetical protein